MSTQTAEETDYAIRRRPPARDVTVVAHDIGSVGGMERQLAALILGLRRLGYRVTVIARTCALPQSDMLNTENGGIDFHRVRGPARPVLFAYPWFMVAGSLVLRRRRRGIVQATGAIVLNRVDVIAVHYCHQVGPTTPSRSTTLFRVHAALMARLTRIAERLCFALNRSATYVCVSEGVGEDVRKHYPQLADGILSIPNGVDTDAFAPGERDADARALRARLGIAADRLLAVFVGSDWERKGLEPLIRALALTPDWDAVVVGGGDRGSYQQLADSLGVGEAVHFLGVSSDVQPAYESGDAFVFPSSYEAFSLVSLEAAASGLPILATPVNGVRELVSDGHSGFLIDRDPHTIAERLAQLAADPALRSRMGSAARKSALEFRWERMVARHDQVYARLSEAARNEPHSSPGS